MRYRVGYEYWVDVDAPTQFDASDMAEEIFAKGLMDGTIRAIDFWQCEPDEITNEEE